MNSINKIIYLIATPFNQRDYKRFGVDVFVNDGFEVYVWDLSPFLYRGFAVPPDPIDFKNLIKFDSFDDVAASLRKEKKKSFVISLLPYGHNTYKIFRVMSKSKIKYSIRANAYPAGEKNKSAKNLINRAARITPRKVMNRIRDLPMRLSGRLFKSESPTFVFFEGAKSSIDKKRINHETQKVWAHSWDYDIYLNEKESGQSVTNTVVFMDSYLSFHPELLFLGVVWARADEYYPLLCKLFDYLEEKLASNVVIAAHPRSHYENQPDFFQGRKVVRGQSSELVKNAKLVILHGSASAYFPALYRKPMLFVMTDGLLKTDFARDIRLFAACFGKAPVNISRELNIDLEDELIVDEKKYAKFENDFIKKKGSEELPYWQIVIKKIKSLDA